MQDLFKICIHHGILQKKDIGLHSHTARKKIRIYCRICQRERDKKRREIFRKRKVNDPSCVNSNVVYSCAIHGSLPQKNIYIGTLGAPGCKICKRESNIISDSKWKENNPQASRKGNLKKKYGMTLEQYNEMLISQKNVCYICKNPETVRKRGVIPPLSVDHCHAWERQGIMYVRKLLCSKCNSSLALLREDSLIARSMVDYIENICIKPHCTNSYNQTLLCGEE